MTRRFTPPLRIKATDMEIVPSGILHTLTNQETRITNVGSALATGMGMFVLQTVNESAHMITEEMTINFITGRRTVAEDGVVGKNSEVEDGDNT